MNRLGHGRGSGLGVPNLGRCPGGDNRLFRTHTRDRGSAMSRSDEMAAFLRILDKGRMVVSGSIADLTDEVVREHLTV